MLCAFQGSISTGQWLHVGIAELCLFLVYPTEWNTNETCPIPKPSLSIQISKATTTYSAASTFSSSAAFASPPSGFTFSTSSEALASVSSASAFPPSVAFTSSSTASTFRSPTLKSFLTSAMTPLNVSADRSNDSLSSEFNPSGSALAAPLFPSTTGRLRQHPSSGTQCEMGRTRCLSKSMVEQMEDTTAPMPKDVAPLPSMMVAAVVRHCSATRSRSKVEGGRASEMGMPLIVAMDQGTWFY